MCPLWLLHHVEKNKDGTIFILTSNNPILDHAHRYLVTRTHIYQQEIIKRLTNEFHVWPKKVCYIQYNFWHHIHQFSTYFHFWSHNRFWNVLISCHWWWHHLKASFHKNVQILKTHILGSIQSKPQVKILWKISLFYQQNTENK